MFGVSFSEATLSLTEKVDVSPTAPEPSVLLALGPRLASGKSKVQGSSAYRHSEHLSRGLVASHYSDSVSQA